MNRTANLHLLTLILASISGCGVPEEGTACITVTNDASTCPAASEVDPKEAFVSGSCDGETVRSLSGAGVRSSDTGGIEICCYEAVLVDPNPNQECMVGRPWREADGIHLAAVPAGPDARAQAWARAGAGEHASIAAFAKLSLELMALGAPTELLRAVHAAAIDEVTHAEACFRMAARLGGVRVQAGPFPFGGPLSLNRPLATVAAEAVREGCLGETLGAVLARRAAEATKDPEVRELLSRIAEDEERHAALSWRIVAWALKTGGPEVRTAVEAALREPVPPFDRAELALRAAVSEATLAEAWQAGLREVLRPAAASLLAA